MTEQKVETEETKEDLESKSCEDKNDNEKLNNEEPEKEKKFISHLFVFIARVFPLVFVVVFSSFLANSFILGDRYVEKALIKKDITSLVVNGAGLRAVKFHYEHRTPIKRDIFFALNKDLSHYYSYDVALSQILEELRTDRFLNGTPDKVYLKKLDSIIREYTESNPFDKLESGQKDLFENIRVKLNDNYSLVTDDVNKLSDELSNKNKLVNEYLSDSQTSLIVSIVSALIAVLLAGFQMWQNRSRQYSRLPPRYRRDHFDEDENRSGVVKVRKERDKNGRLIETRYMKDGSIQRRHM